MAFIAAWSPDCRAAETITLLNRELAAGSPAAPFDASFKELRRVAAETTVVWSRSADDLAAWGPATVFAFVPDDVATDTLTALAAPLEEDAPAPRLLFLTMGMYAAKSRVPFADTPHLRRAIARNLSVLDKAARQPAVLARNPDLASWGEAGTLAWTAYLNLLHRDYWDLGAAAGGTWNAKGLALVERLLAGYRREGGGFRTGADPSDTELALLPNAAAILTLMQAYQNEELVRYESLARDTAEALGPLRDRDGAYFSTAARKAKDARANAYYASALLQLYKNTGDASYRQRAVEVLGWLSGEGEAGRLAGEPATAAHVAHAILLLDSLATHPFENVFGRRPMRLGHDPAPVGEMVARVRKSDFPYRNMLDGLVGTLIDHLPERDGDFAYDYGDSPGYAAQSLLAMGDVPLARRVIERERRLIAGGLLPSDLTEASFGAGALFAATETPVEGVDPDAVAAALRRYLIVSGIVARLDRYYLDWVDWFTNGGGFGYGPTVIGAQIALSQLRYAAGHPQKDGWLLQPRKTGFSLLHATAEEALDPSREVYWSRSGEDATWLLPNAIMVLALLEGHHVSGNQALIERAEAVVNGLEPLWDAKRGAYFASSKQTGMLGYESLSTNSYAALALWRLYKATGEEAYAERARQIISFFQRDLYARGVLYHHVYAGHRAAGDIWCSGCNWRVVSLLIEMAQG